MVCCTPFKILTATKELCREHFTFDLQVAFCGSILSPVHHTDGVVFPDGLLQDFGLRYSAAGRRAARHERVSGGVHLQRPFLRVRADAACLRHSARQVRPGAGGDLRSAAHRGFVPAADDCPDALHARRLAAGLRVRRLPHVLRDACLFGLRLPCGALLLLRGDQLRRLQPGGDCLGRAPRIRA